MQYEDIIKEFEPGILTTIHCEDLFGKEDAEIELCKELYKKYNTKPLLFRLNHKLGLVEGNLFDEVYIVDQQYEHGVDAICKKAEGLILSYQIKIIIVDCLEELVVEDFRGNREGEAEIIKNSLHDLAIKRNVSVILMTEHPDEDNCHPEIDLEKGSLLEQIDQN